MCFFGIYALSFAALVPRPVKGLEVVCLDVGQGDGLLLRSGKRAVLIDGGSSSQKKLGNIVLEPYLKSQGISWIDYAVVSHGDSDHINGLIYLLEESEDIRIGTLVLPVMGKGEEVYENLAALARRKGTDVVYRRYGGRTGEQSGQTGRTGGGPAGYTFESCTDTENSPSWFQDIFIGGISGPIEDSISCGFLWKGKFLWASVAGDNGAFQEAGDCGSGNRKKGSHNT